MKKFIILLIISLILTVESAFVLGMSIFGLKKSENDFFQSVYINESETTFNGNGTISVKIVNISKKSFNDQTLHLHYVNAQNQMVGLAYSNQLVVSIEAQGTKILTFNSMDWDQYISEYNRIKIAGLKNTGVWQDLANGKDIINYYEVTNYTKIASIACLCLFVIGDIVAVVGIKKQRTNKNK